MQTKTRSILATLSLVAFALLGGAIHAQTLTAPLVTVDELPGGVLAVRVEDNSLADLDWSTFSFQVGGLDRTAEFVAYAVQVAQVSGPFTTVRVDVPIASSSIPAGLWLYPTMDVTASIRRKAAAGGQLGTGGLADTDPLRGTIRGILRLAAPGLGVLSGADLWFELFPAMSVNVWPLLHLVEAPYGSYSCYPLVGAHKDASGVVSMTDYVIDTDFGCISEPIRFELIDQAMEIVERLADPGTGMWFVGGYYLATPTPEWTVFPFAHQ